MTIARPLYRAIGHVAVIALLGSSAALAAAALHPLAGSSGELSFDVVARARGAAEAIASQTVHFELQPDPEQPDPLLSRRILPTPAPTPSPKPTPKASHRAAPVQRVVAIPAPVLAVVGNGRLLWPVPGAVITQYFSAYHLAIDMAADYGSPVLAAASGTVVSAGWRSNGGGLVIEIDHGNGMHTLYNHLGAILISVGQVVGRGQRIASVGCTGNCTGPHVHFQVTVGGIFVNPLRYL